ncbi:hypothetical protein NBRC10513v2_003293 [Rhodotorula toruloides]|uniref:BY PROTMAP: gi/472584523/gb/EMS22109.1/ Rho guanyl-nucleotide exchange factor [Rhodosporidium toruloides NP11] gi/647399370/emb/CDR43995.1/ RHTO0S08e09098g1_1 [Rhodosporidium toruloides] n=1 Tax=Rhodotorula toruloides TaxID=5286 RepID=A0A0K3CE55_RHOTO|nr:hypothetical protein AAT19DRAFT_14464 [Rhodotorula toruloides]
MSGSDAHLSLFTTSTSPVLLDNPAQTPPVDGEFSKLMKETGASGGKSTRSNGERDEQDGRFGSNGLSHGGMADLRAVASEHSLPQPLASVSTGHLRRDSLAGGRSHVGGSQERRGSVLDRRTSELLEQTGLADLLDNSLVHPNIRPPSNSLSPSHSTSSVSSTYYAAFAEPPATTSTRPVPRSPPRSSRTLSSAALAALADSPARPPRPPKSPARPPSRASIASSANSGAATEGGGGTPDAGHVDSGVPSAVRPFDSPSLDESAGLAFPRLRAGTASTDRTPALSTASSASARNSAVFYSSLEEEAEDDGEPWNAATPATTVDYSSPAFPSLDSPAIDPHAASPAYKRARPVEHLQLHLAPPMSPSSTTDTLKGLGLNFFTASGASSSSTTVSSPLSATVPPILNEDDLDRELERLSQYAKSLPSPLPGVFARSDPSFAGVADWVAHDGDAGELVMEEKTLVVDQLRAVGPIPPVPPLPPHFPSTHPLPASRSREPSATSSLASPSRRPSLLNLPNYHSAPSARDYLSPIPGLGMADETDFVSTTDAGEDDDDEEDEADDSFGFQIATRPPPNAFGRNEKATSLWNEDVAWRGSPAVSATAASQGEREREDVIDWSDAPVEKRELPRETTHLILARSKTPFQIAPLLTNAVPTLTHGLVVLDIRECGLSEIPSAIASCCFLQELDVSGNSLAMSTLPSFLGTLPALNVLLADECNLASLPNSLSQLTRLHTLSLRRNRLRMLPSWLCRLTALETFLVDENPFVWEVQNLVRPLLVDAGVEREDGARTPLSHAPSPILPSSFRSTPSPLPPPSLPLESRPPSPAFARSRSNSSTPAWSSSVAPSPALSRASSRGDLSESLGSLMLREDASPLPMPSPAFSSVSGETGTEPVDTDKKEKRKWGQRLLKKVSAGRLRSSSNASKRPGALDADARTFSQPVTRGEESEAEKQVPSSGGMFGSLGRKTIKRSKGPAQVPRSAPPVNKRKSFLLLDAFSPTPASPGTPALNDHATALRNVLAYLRDLDDLSPDVSLPAIPLDNPSPHLRHSPSLGALTPGGLPRPASPASMRRAQSTRRLPSNGSLRRGSSAHFSQFLDDSPDPSDRSSSILSTPDLAASKVNDDPAKRDAILKEIVATEQSYLRGLEELCGIYVASASVPVSSSMNGGKKDTVVPTAERRAVFGNIEAIRDFHRKILLPDLLAAVRAGGDSTTIAEKVGEVFVDHASFMKIYSGYINGFDDALARIQSWGKNSSSRPSAGAVSPALASSTTFDATASIAQTLSSSQRKRIRSWLKRCRAHPSHSQISLESYLLLPIQRIPRYRLLLESLSSCTPAPIDAAAGPLASSLPSDSLFAPHPVISEAVAEMDAVATTLNESKRENEGRAQLVMWQNRLVTKFKSPLVQPHRTLLRSGYITLVRSVKRSTTQMEQSPPSLYRTTSGRLLEQPEPVATLFQDTKQVELIALLCTDLLVLCRRPPPPFDADPNSPVELYTVLRLNSARGTPFGSSGRSEPPASVFGADDLLRVKIGDKAICYFRCVLDNASKNRKEASAWANAINVQWEVNT